MYFYVMCGKGRGAVGEGRGIYYFIVHFTFKFMFRDGKTFVEFVLVSCSSDI